MSAISLLAANDSSSGSSLGFFLPLIAIGALMYFFLLRPQRKRMRQTAELQQTIDVGDEIMTTTGVFGFVTQIENDIAWIEIDDNVQIRIARQAIQRKVDTVAGDVPTPSDDGTKPNQTKIDEPSAAPADDES